MSPGLHVRNTPRVEAGDEEGGSRVKQKHQKKGGKLPIKAKFDPADRLLPAAEAVRWPRGEAGGQKVGLVGWFSGLCDGRAEQRLFHTRRQQCGSRPAA